MSHYKGKYTKKGEQHPDRLILKKWFGDLEVVEAKKELRIQPNQDDIKGAVTGDPANCVFSRACQRMWDSHAVVFFGTVAYVDLLDKNGTRRIERFKISSEGKKFIRDFDNGENVEPKGFLLIPPTKSQTAQAAAASSRASRRKAILKGNSRGGSTIKRPKRTPSSMRVSVFRNGMGMAQFPTAQSAAAHAAR